MRKKIIVTIALKNSGCFSFSSSNSKSRCFVANGECIPLNPDYRLGLELKSSILFQLIQATVQAVKLRQQLLDQVATFSVASIGPTGICTEDGPRTTRGSIDSTLS